MDFNSTKERDEYIVKRIEDSNKRRGIFTEVAREVGLSRAAVHAKWRASGKDALINVTNLTAHLPGVKVSQELYTAVLRSIAHSEISTVANFVRFALNVACELDVKAIQSAAEKAKMDVGAFVASTMDKACKGWAERK